MMESEQVGEGMTIQEIIEEGLEKSKDERTFREWAIQWIPEASERFICKMADGSGDAPDPNCPKQCGQHEYKYSLSDIAFRCIEKQSPFQRSGMWLVFKKREEGMNWREEYAHEEFIVWLLSHSCTAEAWIVGSIVAQIMLREQMDLTIRRELRNASRQKQG